MIEKIIVVAPTTAVPMSTGFAVALNVFPAPSFSSSKCFAEVEADIELKVSLEFLFDTIDLLDEGKLEHALSVVSHRPIGIDSDGHGAHPEKSEGD